MTLRGAFLFLSLLAASCTAASINSPLAFLNANSDVFQILMTIIKKAGQEAKFNSSVAVGTYFIPTDFALDGELAPYLPPNSTLSDLRAAVEAGSAEAAQNYVAGFSVNQTIPTITDLLSMSSRGRGFQSLANDTLSVGIVDGSFLAVFPRGSDNQAYIAGPVAVPCGKAVVYVTDASLTSPLPLIS